MEPTERPLRIRLRGVGRRPGGQVAGLAAPGAQRRRQQRCAPLRHLTAECRAPHAGRSDPDRQLTWPALPAAVVASAGFVLGAGFYRASPAHALFPAGAVGWALAVLTGVIVGHLVALGRDRWWGGTGSGAALTLAVLLLYGWVPAGMVSLTVVVLVGMARRHRWRQGVLHGAVGHPRHRRRRARARRVRRVPVRRDPGSPDLDASARPPRWCWSPPPTSPVTRAAALVLLHAPRGGLPTVARTALVRQGLVAVALLGIAPLICVVAVAQPVLLPLFAVPLIALDSTLWIARARAEEQLRDPLTGLPNRQWLLERTWTALDEAERIGARSALVLIDLDRFRSVNDTLGHLAGDRLLLQIADRLRLALPRGAEAARLGGDEFAVLLPVADSTTSAQPRRPQPGRRPRLPARPRRTDPRPGGQRRRRRLPRPRAGRGGAAAARRRGDVPGEAGPYGRRGVRVQAGLQHPRPARSAGRPAAGARRARGASCTTSPRSASTAQVAGLRGAGALGAPGAGEGAAGRVHRDRRVVRADAASDGVRAGDGARPGRAVARAGAVGARSPSTSRRVTSTRPASPARSPRGWPGTGSRRERSNWR